MSQEHSIEFHHIDFLLPTHRFNIKFAYVSKKALPFVREFILRLLNISPMKPSQIANYFDFSKHEIAVALTELVDLCDITYTDEGEVKLTNQSQKYFLTLDSSPETTAIEEYKGIFTFELASFQCTGIKRTHDRWHSGVSLDVCNEIKATSESLAKKHFQLQFYQLLERRYISDKVETDDGKPPTLYKMESVKKVWQGPLRLSQSFSMTTEGAVLERNDIEILDDDAKVQELITTAIHNLTKPDNLNYIITAMAELNDRHTGKFLTDDSINVLKLLAEQTSAKINSIQGKPFLGPIYSKYNWKKLTEIINPILRQMANTHQDGLDDLIWLAPSCSFWGKSTQVSSCFSEFIEKAHTKGKKAKTLYRPKLYVPMHSDDDKRTKNQWQQTFGQDNSHIYGLLEGFLDGNVEVILLSKRFIVVCYHLSRPHTSKITMPLGFISTNNKTINYIEGILKDYISGFSSHDNRRNFGPIFSMGNKNKKK